MLYPPILRDFLLGMANVGLYKPLWSEGVAAEWLTVTARRSETGAAAALERMNARWPDAMTPPGEAAHLDVPDPHDRHILAAAIAGRADALCTQNLRDFPRRALVVHGIEPLAPDDLAMRLWLKQSAPVEAQVARVWPDLSGRALRKALQRAKLPRLGKALEMS